MRVEEEGAFTIVPSLYIEGAMIKSQRKVKYGHWRATMSSRAHSVVRL